MPQTINKNESSKVKEIQRIKIVENNYRNNLNSNYTEKIKELDQNFKYRDHDQHYWSQPELSILYGTPFYEVASPAQKLALNHLFYVSQYNYAAYSEIETIDYNQITGDCFSKMGGKYELIAHQLEHESDQERVHIHSFFKINYQTMKALLGKQAFTNPLEKKTVQNSSIKEQLSNHQYSALRFLNELMLKGKQSCHSPHLEKLEKDNKFSSTTTRGFFHGRGVLPPALIRFFALNWSSSPFLACQYYTVRYIANMLLKNQEHDIFMYFRKLKKQGEFIPVPTEIAYYHFLDEAFHTTTSLFLARDLHKNFSKPTAYEKLLINLAVYVIQKVNLSQLSGVVRNRFFGDDISGMVDIYKLLRSSLFAMSHQEAMKWVEKCFCTEHEGFHQSAKSYHRLHSETCQLCEKLEYLWPVNREMSLMASGGGIDQAIKSNIKTFKGFSKFIAQSHS